LLALYSDPEVMTFMGGVNKRSHCVAEKLGCVPDKTVLLADFDRPAVVWEHPRDGGLNGHFRRLRR